MKPYNIEATYLVIFLILAAPQAYNWQQHSISQLGAQGYADAWIMRLGFIGFGAPASRLVATP
jgi:hypothetical membrane protein